MAGSVKSRVIEALREAIFSGTLQPGSPLRKVHLASSMGVSQATVRKALKALQHVGQRQSSAPLR
jgi:DNA-binding GntR family transcriptional regulator